MAVHLLTTTRLTEAVRQLILNQHFPRHNEHITEQEYGGLLAAPPIWPASPVFSPYAVTHGGYSQVRIDGIKYLVHRITFAAHHGAIHADQDVSHTVYLGARTARNINPRHLVQETNEMYQGRKLCFQYMEALLCRWSIGMFGAPAWGDDDLRRFLLESNGACELLHEVRCDCIVALWD